MCIHKLMQSQSTAPVQMRSKKSSGQKGLLNTHSTLMAFDICTLCMAICAGTHSLSFDRRKNLLAQGNGATT